MLSDIMLIVIMLSVVYNPACSFCSFVVVVVVVVVSVVAVTILLFFL
jgi:hypothetical protein